MPDETRIQPDAFFDANETKVTHLDHLSHPSASPILNDHRQFSLSDLFALMTLVALVCSLTLPLLRWGLRAGFYGVAGALLLDACIMGYCYRLISRKRSDATRTAGRRLAIVYHGVARWRHMPVVLGWLSLLMVSSVVVLFGVINAHALLDFKGPLILVVLMLAYHQIPIAGYFTMVACRFHWKVHPRTIEIFEHGVIRWGIRFYGWDQIAFRASNLFSDRVVCVLYEEAGKRSGDTLMLHVVPEWKQKILEEQAARQNPPSPCIRETPI